MGANLFAEPAIVFDIGGKFDKSFNESAWNGAEKWKSETGGSYREIEIQSEAQREQALRRLAEGGSNPIVMTGFAFGSVLDNVAPDFPDTNFAIIDFVVAQPNVKSIVFKEHEGSYLVGLIAGMTTASNTVGFVGGMDIPLIRRFGCGYVQGVKAANPDINVIQNMTGNDPSAWNDPVKGGELTKAQIASGADVVYHAAGGTGVGVLQAAADAGILGIGVDANQNHLHPGSVLTSMLKRVDVAVYNSFSEGMDLNTSIVVLGLKEDGVGYALDENNQDLISAEVLEMVEATKASIINGDTVVHDYTTDDSCPAS
ncbi:MAG: BMP family ABC transporter substrate-binding protein [Rhodobacteraceae bacterium]|nr:BMP family ABC transporter substrate-binding protein [Paracoccaceae bacterium]MDE2758798.1 BMP family ABC transporter substrate-binding protein [Paracoccaceae bacterium]MDE2917441.1 BMP family ABC transporter substrate-binding protein [Paracoccaceae bacterium]MYG41925.1 BMP family ABC transporter substrate-binding protein [Paracoccaceae bacterium]